MPAELVQTLPIIETKLSAELYFDIVEKLQAFLQSDKSNFKDFKELSFEAWRYSKQVNAERAKDEESKTDWFPTLDEYDPGFSAEDWYNLLTDSEVFDENSLFVVKAFFDIGGQATCKQLAEKYGHEPGFYNIVSTKLAKRIHVKTNCPLMPKEINKNAKWWTILYQGKSAKGEAEGNYIWRLREELSTALSMPTDEKATNTPVIWKISHGTPMTSGITIEMRKIFEEKIVVINQFTGPAGGSKITQGYTYMNEIKKGDYFFLCYAGEIVLLGQFTENKAKLNKERGTDWDDYDWYEKSYRLIARSAIHEKYTGKKKVWT